MYVILVWRPLYCHGDKFQKSYLNIKLHDVIFLMVSNTWVMEYLKYGELSRIGAL